MDTCTNKHRRLDTLLQSYLELRERGPPRKRNIQSVRNWLDGNKPLSSSDMDIFRNPNDLVGVKSAEDYGMIEDIVMKASTVVKDLVYKIVSLDTPAFELELIAAVTDTISCREKLKIGRSYSPKIRQQTALLELFWYSLPAYISLLRSSFFKRFRKRIGYGLRESSQFALL